MDSESETDGSSRSSSYQTSEAASSSSFNDAGSSVSQMMRRNNNPKLWRQKDRKRKWMQRSPRVCKSKRKKRVNIKFEVTKKEEGSTSYSPLSPAPMAKYAPIALDRASTSYYSPQSPVLVNKMETESAVIKDEEVKFEAGFSETDSPQSPVLVNKMKRFKAKPVAMEEEKAKASHLPFEKLEEDSDDLIMAFQSSPEQEEDDENVPLLPSNDVENFKRESLLAGKGPSLLAPKKEGKYFLCDECDFRTSSHIALTRHVGAEHPFLTVPLPSFKKEPFRVFQCAICEYKTEEKHRFDRHKVHHLTTSAHGCNVCNFSADSPDQLGFHLKRHHLQMKKDKPADKKKASKSVPATSHSHGNTLRKESAKDEGIASSGKSAHSSAKTEAEPQTRKRHAYDCCHCSFSTNDSARMKLHQMKHERISAHQCNHCSFSSDSKGALTLHLNRQHSTDASAPKKQKCMYECQFCDFETHDAANMRAHDTRHKRNFNFKCSRCNYSSNTASAVKKHENYQHLKLGPPADSVAPKKTAQSKIDKKRSLKCKYCHYSTNHYKKMDDHIDGHQGKGKLKCPRCTFSSDIERTIYRHQKRHHTDEEKPEERQPKETKNEEGKIEQKKVIKNRLPEEEVLSSSLETHKEKQEHLTLHELEAEEAKCLKCISSFEAAIDSDQNKIEELRAQIKEEEEKEEDEIQPLRKRLGVMREKVRNADKDLKDVMSKLKTVRDKISQVAAQKRILEKDLRSLKAKSDAVELQFYSFEYGAQAARKEEDRLTAEKKRCKEGMVKVETLLKSLGEEEKILLEDVEIEEGSLTGVSQVVQAMEAELEDLESSLQGGPFLQEQLNQLTVSLENRMAKYLKVEKRFFEIRELKIVKGNQPR